MEPGVVEVLSQCLEPVPASSATGLLDLLGAQHTVQGFLTSAWESEPLICRFAPQETSTTSRKECCTMQHSSAGLQPSQGSDAPAKAALLQLRPVTVVNGLMSGAMHCPVLDAAVEDPVQVCMRMWDVVGGYKQQVLASVQQVVLYLCKPWPSIFSEERLFVIGGYISWFLSCVCAD